MKVPVYRSQTGLPERTGAGQLSVQASPSAFGAPGAAQFGAGQAVAQEGLRWLEHFQKTDQALAVADETKKMRTLIQQIDDKTHQEPVETWTDADGNQLGYFDKQKLVRLDFSRAQNLHLQNIPKSSVRASMAGAWATAITNARTQTDATMRGKYMSFVKGRIKKSVTDELKVISTMKSGPVKNGAIADLKIKIADFHVLAPFIGDFYMEGVYQNLESSAGEIAIRQQIDGITDSTKAKLWLRYIDKPKRGDPFFEDVQRLVPKRNQQLVERLEKLKTQLLNSEHNSGMKKLREDVVKKTIRQNKGHDLIADRITAVRSAYAQGKEPGEKGFPESNGKPMTVPSMDFIDKADISPSHKKGLSDMLTGQDRVYNREYVSRIKVQIWEAITPDDLDEIQDDFRKDREANVIGGLAIVELNREMDKARGKTPEVLELKRYTELIDDIMKSKNFIYKDGPSHQREDSNNAAGFASFGGKMDFANQVASGVRPVNAFYNVMNKVKENRDAIVASQITTVPAGYLDADIVADPLKLRPVHIENAMETLRTQAAGISRKEELEVSGEELLAMSPRERGELQRAGKLPMRQRRTVRQLLAIEAQLNYLKVAAEIYKKKPPPPPPPPSDDVEEPGSSGPKAILDYVVKEWKNAFGDDEDKDK